MADLVVKRNDWGEVSPLRVQLFEAEVDGNGDVVLGEDDKPVMIPMDLTNAEVVHFYFAPKAGDPPTKSGAMTFVDKPTGRLSYPWKGPEAEGGADLAAAGTFKLEFEVTLKESGGVVSVPTEGWYELKVEEDLGP
jgi:hypothetical protein